MYLDRSQESVHGLIQYVNFVVIEHIKFCNKILDINGYLTNMKLPRIDDSLILLQPC